MTVTIDIPDATAARFEAVATARGQDVPAFLIDAGYEIAEAEETVDIATLDALRVGLADIDAGRTLTLEEANARFEQDLADARRKAIRSRSSCVTCGIVWRVVPRCRRR